MQFRERLERGRERLVFFFRGNDGRWTHDYKGGQRPNVGG